MTDAGPWMRLLLAALATWRLTHLLAREDGPGDLIVRLRNALGRSFFGRLMDCFYCLSLWVALPIAWLLASRLSEVALVWLALSGAACLMERMGEPAIVAHPSPPFEENQG